MGLPATADESLKNEIGSGIELRVRLVWPNRSLAQRLLFSLGDFLSDCTSSRL